MAKSKSAAKQKLKVQTGPPLHEVLNKHGVISWFDDFGGAQPHAFLSNFYVGEPIELPLLWSEIWDAARGHEWGDESIIGRTGEHLFAAFKADNWLDFDLVLETHDPGKAKALGRTVPLTERWEEIKLDVMAAVVRSKFTLERAEGQLLLDTGDQLLIEGTFWRDRVWGVDLRNRHSNPLRAPGRNWLGSLLMMRRSELRAEQVFGVRASTPRFNALFSV